MIEEDRKYILPQNNIAPTPVSGFGFVPLAQVEDKQLSWLIEDILLCEGLTILSGRPKSGKSTLLINLLNCSTNGEDFLDTYKTEKIKCLYYSLEDLRTETRKRCERMTKDGQISQDLLISLADSVRLPRDFERIAIDIEQSGARVIVIDTLRRSHVSNEDSSTDMAPILGGIRELIRKYHIQIILVHHAGHRIESKKDPGNWLRGTSDLNGSWETLLGLEKENGDHRLFVFHKYRPEFEIALKTDFESSISFQINDRLNNENLDEENKILVYLKNEEFSGNQLKSLTGLSRPKIKVALERLVAKRKIVGRGSGNKTKWSLLRFDSNVNEEKSFVF